MKVNSIMSDVNEVRSHFLPILCLIFFLALSLARPAKSTLPQHRVSTKSCSNFSSTHFKMSPNLSRSRSSLEAHPEPRRGGRSKRNEYKKLSSTRDLLLPHHPATHYYSISSSWFPGKMGPKTLISAHSSLAEAICHMVFRDTARRDNLNLDDSEKFSARFISSFINGANTKSLSSLISPEIVNFDLFGDTRFPCLGG